MTIFRPLAARKPQRPPGQAWRNKVLADSADDPDDAAKPDDLRFVNISAGTSVSGMRGWREWNVRNTNCYPVRETFASIRSARYQKQMRPVRSNRASCRQCLYWKWQRSYLVFRTGASLYNVVPTWTVIYLRRFSHCTPSTRARCTQRKGLHRVSHKSSGVKAVARKRWSKSLCSVRNESPW